MLQKVHGEGIKKQKILYMIKLTKIGMVLLNTELEFGFITLLKGQKFSNSIGMLLLGNYKGKEKILCFIKIISGALYQQVFDCLGKPNLLNIKKAKFCSQPLNFL